MWTNHTNTTKVDAHNLYFCYNDTNEINKGSHTKANRQLCRADYLAELDEKGLSREPAAPAREFPLS